MKEIKHLKNKNRKKFYIVSSEFYMNLLYKSINKNKNDKPKIKKLYSPNFRLSSLIKTNKDYKYIYIEKFLYIKTYTKLKLYMGAYKK